MVYLLARRRIGFVWTSSVVKLMFICFAVCVVIGVISTFYWWGVLVSVGLMLIAGVYALARLAHMSNLGGLAARMAGLAQRWSRVIGLKNE